VKRLTFELTGIRQSDVAGEIEIMPGAGTPEYVRLNDRLQRATACAAKEYLALSWAYRGCGLGQGRVRPRGRAVAAEVEEEAMMEAAAAAELGEAVVMDDW